MPVDTNITGTSSSFQYCGVADIPHEYHEIIEGDKKWILNQDWHQCFCLINDSAWSGGTDPPPCGTPWQCSVEYSEPCECAPGSCPHYHITCPDGCSGYMAIYGYESYVWSCP